MANTQIKSDKEVSVLVDTQTYLNHSTTIKYNNRIFKLVTNHRNGDESVVIYLFTECNGWVLLYNHFEIKDVAVVNYSAKINEQEFHSIQNYYAMVAHIKKVFA